MEKNDRAWPQKRNGVVCPECGALMENTKDASVCPSCGRTHEGRLGVVQR